MPPADNLSRALLALILLCVVVGILRDGDGSSRAPSNAHEAATLQPDGERYTLRIVGFQRKPPLMLRTDTATGEAWTMSVLGPGRWEALREGPGGVPSPDADAAGRYEILAVKLSRGAPNLVRTDSRTGRIWRKGSLSAGPWVPVPNPGEEPPAAAKAPKKNAKAATEPAVDEGVDEADADSAGDDAAE